MKTITTKVAIGSDQLDDKFVFPAGTYTPEQLAEIRKAKPQARFAVDPKNRVKAGRVTVPLGNVDVNVPESKGDVLELLSSDPALVVKTLATQLVTNAANEFRKGFTKAGDAQVRAGHRMAVQAWLWTPTGQPFAAEYLKLLASGNTKLVNEWLDQKYDEELNDDETA